MAKLVSVPYLSSKLAQDVSVHSSQTAEYVSVPYYLSKLMQKVASGKLLKAKKFAFVPYHLLEQAVAAYSEFSAVCEMMVMTG